MARFQLTAIIVIIAVIIWIVAEVIKWRDKK